MKWLNRISPADRNFVLVVGLLIVPIAIYWQSMITMAGNWSTDAYRHGYVIPIVSVLLLWRERARYGAMTFSGSWIGAALLGILVAVWAIAQVTSVQTIAQVSVVLMISAFAVTVLGTSAYRLIWFPLAFLVFAVPVGDSAVPYLMDWTATIAVAALRVLGIPALREGMIVSLPGGSFEVVEACSGYNYLNAGIALGVLVAHLMFRVVWKQTIYLAAVVIVFVIVNGARAFTIMYVGSVSHMQLLVGREHLIFGWILFVLAMGLMYWIAERYSDVRRTRASGAVE